MPHRPTPPDRARRGFSLVELMIAITMGLIILGVLTFSVTTSGEASNRAISSNQVHLRARTFLDFLERDFRAMVPTAAFRIENFGHPALPEDNISDGDFPRTAFTLLVAADRLDRDFDNAATDPTDYAHDLVWVRYVVEKDEARSADLSEQMDEDQVVLRVRRLWLPVLNNPTPAYDPAVEDAMTPVWDPADLPAPSQPLDDPTWTSGRLTDLMDRANHLDEPDEDSDTEGHVVEATVLKNVRFLQVRAFHPDLNEDGDAWEWSRESDAGQRTDANITFDTRNGLDYYSGGFYGRGTRGRLPNGAVMPALPDHSGGTVIPDRVAYLEVRFVLESDSGDLQKEFVREVPLPVPLPDDLP
jgi:prepilin-type N-terminal cleavage/methylation domain-containing protein